MEQSTAREWASESYESGYELGLKTGLYRNRRAYTDQLEALLRDTPDLNAPGAWWPFDADDERYREGARWVEAWWRARIGEVLATGEGAQ